jgi:hypothetical protein
MSSLLPARRRHPLSDLIGPLNVCPKHFDQFLDNRVRGSVSLGDRLSHFWRQPVLAVNTYRLQRESHRNERVQ